MVAVYVRLPRAGLGNRLLVWARAAVFAGLNGLECYVSGGNPIQIGSWLRGERRSARSHFRFSQSYLDAARARFCSIRKLIQEPKIEVYSELDQGVLFNKVPPWQDYFQGLRENREAVLELFLSKVASRILKSVQQLAPPCVAIHVRRGDFRKLRPDEDFARTGGTRTPDKYFADSLHMIRESVGWAVPATIFSDGTDEECAALLRLPGVHRAPRLSDLGHMLLMSRAKFIVPSAGSTFSLWSGFLSDAAILHHPAHFRVAVRPSTINDIAFEGAAPDLGGVHPTTLVDAFARVAAMKSGSVSQ